MTVPTIAGFSLALLLLTVALFSEFRLRRSPERLLHSLLTDLWRPSTHE
jgi:hypothetical protein